MRSSRTVVVCVVLGVLSVLSGCIGPYKLPARVIHGSASGMFFVPADSPELEGDGIPGVQFTVYRDPDSLGRKRAGGGRSGKNGDAVVEIRGLGTGWLQEEWLFHAVAAGYETAILQAPLPSRLSDQVLVVVLRPGQSIAPVDPWAETMKDYERYR